jgi:uncharacterized membrane protein SpoIIM required for sporulation/uncharacterized RDD family membrane protein YckC
MTAGPRAPLDLRQEHGVETPEHVEVRLELAGVGSRTAAWLIDLALVWLVTILALLLALGLVTTEATQAARWAFVTLFLLNAFLLIGYFAVCEAASGGRTPGKQLLGLRTVMDTGKRITVTAAIVRALLLIVDFPLLIGPVLMTLHRSNKRLGDLAAGTIVVRDRPTEWTPLAAVDPAAAEAVTADVGPPQLTDDEFKLLDQFLARAHDLDADVQARLRNELARRFDAKVPRRERPIDVYLVELFADEQQRRRGRFATRAMAGAAGRTTVTAERFVARRRDTWLAFDQLARRVERDGLRTLPPAEIPPFAARYREVAADLARARTYNVDRPVMAYLERLVSAGHNALYRGHGRGRPSLGHYLLRDFPAAVVESWPQVLAAFVLFAVPAGVGYAVLRERPALAEVLTSPVMIDRAERAAAERESGRGYAQAAAADQAALSAYLIGNNIRVSFNALAGGMLAGTVTVLVLITNGLMLGVVFGLFANYGAAGHLGTFIIGHGVLELTAIFIAAGAGFRLAGAIITPGDRTRRDALVLEGIVAARMIGAVVCLLVLAGTIEGLLSASAAPPEVKWGTGAVSAVLLALYLMNGARYRRGVQPSQARTT